MSYKTFQQGLAGYVDGWQLDETSGTSIASDSGTRTGTVSGSVTLGATGLVADGGTSISNVPQSGYVGTILGSAPLNAISRGAFWVSVWFKVASKGSAQALVHDSAYGLIALSVDSSGHLTYRGIVTGSTDVTDGATHHAFLYRDGSSNVVIILDGNTGSPEASGTNGDDLSFGDPTNVIGIGATGTGADRLAGTVDAAAIGVGSVPTTTQIHTLYLLGTGAAVISVAGPGGGLSLPSNHPGNGGANISVTLSRNTGTWTGSETITVSGVSGWAKSSQTFNSGPNTWTIVLTCPSSSGATGTLSFADSVIIAGTIAVGAATVAASPTSANNGSTTSLTMTGANTLWAGETAAGLFTVSNPSGGTASLGTPTGITDTSATVALTLSSGSAAGSITITDVSTGATFTFTVNHPTNPAFGTNALTIASNSSSAIHLAWTAASGGTGSPTYAAHRSTTGDFTPSGGTSLAGSLTSTYSDTTAASGTNYYYRIVATDTISNTGKSNQVLSVLYPRDVIMAVLGDSNSGGSGTSPLTNLWSEAIPYLQKGRRLRNVTVNNQAKSGADSSAGAGGWSPGATSGYYAAAIAIWQAMSPTPNWLGLMLGTNDEVGATSAATLASNISGIVTQAKSDLPTLTDIAVVIPPYCGANREDLIYQYRTALPPIDNGVNIHVIGRRMAEWFGQNQATDLQSDLIHLTNLGHQNAGFFLAQEIDDIESALSHGVAYTTSTCTVIDASTSLALSGVDCWVTADSAGTNKVTGVAATDSSGHVTFHLVSGTTYYFWAAKSGGYAPIFGTSFTA